MIKKALLADVKDSFNQLSVDGDTSTNDMAMIMANGMAGNGLIDCENDDFSAFCAALHEVTAYITKNLAADLYTLEVEITSRYARPSRI
jgi:glutamate N-acetyltransferase/amino-acid N-acetyltransferase